MDNLLGLVFYREEDIIYDTKLKPAAYKIEISHLIAYKMSQEWFYKVYNLNSASTLFWFNDCLIRFLGIDAVDKALPHIQLMNLFMVQSFHEVLGFDTSYTSSFNSSYEFPRCIKVSIMLRMLQNALSENIFWKFISTYIINNDLDYKNLARSLNESIVDTHLSTLKVQYKSEILDMIPIMDPWTKQKHYPTISIKRNYDDHYDKIEVLIVNYNSSYHYCVPLTYTTQSDINFNDTLPSYWLNTSSSYLFNLKLKTTDWLIFNIQQVGHYRVNYDRDNWKRIAFYLTTENYMKMHVLNSAQIRSGRNIINDAFHFMITKQLESFIFWKITKYLGQETDFVVWYPMFKALEYMSSVFPLSREESYGIKLRMRSIFRKVLERLEYEEISNENDFRKRLRQEAAKWACFFDDYKCHEMANRVLKRHLEHPAKYKLLPWWKKWTYYNGLKLMSHSPIFNYENTTWSIAHYLGSENFKTKMSEFFACFEHPDIITNYLNLKGTNNETSLILPKDFSTQDYIKCFLFTIAKYAREDEGLNFILHTLIDIKPKQIKIAVVYTVLINHLYFKERIEKVKKFLTRQLKESENYILNVIKESFEEPLDKVLKVTAEMIYVWKNKTQLHEQFLTKLDIRSHQIESQMKNLNNLVIY
ncbi:aminopeptidase N-like [Cataglyphis hispanica]|uniref:aminopeptidase N-like n=1 Tax=Cataglyphis hispanica TaxID=1086592 RepID=UPI0021808FC6|nr:aminopeptidase N-like [Cataglyphis hispanica]